MHTSNLTTVYPKFSIMTSPDQECVMFKCKRKIKGQGLKLEIKITLFVKTISILGYEIASGLYY